MNVLSERGLVTEGGTTRGPGILRLGLAGALLAVTATTAESASATPLGAGDLRGGVPHGGADLVDLHLHHGALLPLPGFERTLHQQALGDHAHPLGEGLGHVLRGLTPDRAAHEQRFAVFPLLGLPVELAGGGCDSEVRDGRPRGGESQFRVSGQVADHRDRKSTRLNSSHVAISYAVFCLKKNTSNTNT